MQATATPAGVKIGTPLLQEATTHAPPFGRSRSSGISVTAPAPLHTARSQSAGVCWALSIPDGAKSTAHCPALQTGVEHPSAGVGAQSPALTQGAPPLLLEDPVLLLDEPPLLLEDPALLLEEPPPLLEDAALLLEEPPPLPERRAS